MIYSAVMSAGKQVLPAAQFQKSGTLVAATLLDLIENVQAASGEEVVIMGSKAALAKLNTLSETNWISDSMKEERHTTGRLGLWEGTRLLEIPQGFVNNDVTKKLVDNNKLLIMPIGDNKFIKMFDEGDSIVREISDGSQNMDMTLEYEYQRKLGVAVVIQKRFGLYDITG